MHQQHQAEISEQLETRLESVCTGPLPVADRLELRRLVDAETLLEDNPNRRHEIDQIVCFLNEIRTEADVSVN